VEQCRHVIRIENRAESNAQIVVRPGVEIDFVAHVQAQANGSEMCLQSSARIENSVYVIRTQAIDAAEESAQGGGGAVEAKIDEAPFKVTNG
jgi:hypothetical protein